jgi:hypothetical protein
VLPYLGGPFVDSSDGAGGRHRVVGATAPGYWRFEISGPVARAIEPADRPLLDDLPAVRGHWVAGYVVGERAVAHRLSLGPSDEPPRFAPVVARRWPGRALVFDHVDTPTATEDRVVRRVRAAFEAGNAPDGSLVDVPAALVAAYGYATMLRVSTALRVPVRPIQLRWHIGELVAMGDAAAERILTESRERRAGEPNRVERWRAARVDARLRDTSSRDRVVDRASAALHAAGAALRERRWLSGDLLEVRYDFLDDRFVSVADGETLRVVDAGIAPARHDERLTLASLPGVIAEAVRTFQLEITAW